MTSELESTAKAARKRLVRMHYESKTGHIGGNLSCLDAMLALHHSVMTPKDTFILSKGHAAGALYITMWSLGKLPEDELKTFHKDNTRLAGHPIAMSFPSCRFATGSLGHGLGLAVGVAVARKLNAAGGHTFCLTSDGEWQEGSTWESFHFAVSKRLANITIIVDENGLQGFGKTQDVLPLPSLAKRMAAFDVEVVECSGHDLKELVNAFSRGSGCSAESSARPRIVILKTVKGKGVSFMENKMEWHYRQLSDADFAQACQDLDA